ncbi:MAG: polyprenyl synthetase family protein [Nakamurella sp.]
MPGFELVDPTLMARVAHGLDRVEQLLASELDSEFSFVTEASSHLVAAGGKRFRPLFTLVAAGIGPHGDSDDVVTAGAVVELIHLATLYHDDVMDEAAIRRGTDSANARWDNSIAILAGDFVFARASRLVAQLGPDAVRIIADTFAELVSGQIRETVGPRPGEDPIAHHLTVLNEKTASLIDTCARYGGMFSGATTEQTSTLRRYARALGVAFQLSDDINDIASVDSGKTPGTDLKEGVRTLPMLYTLADPDADPELLDLLAGPIHDDSAVDRAVELLRASPGLAKARATLDDYAASARRELAMLPPSPEVSAMGSLTTFVVERSR